MDDFHGNRAIPVSPQLSQSVDHHRQRELREQALCFPLAPESPSLSPPTKARRSAYGGVRGTPEILTPAGDGALIVSLTPALDAMMAAEELHGGGQQSPAH